MTKEETRTKMIKQAEWDLKYYQEKVQETMHQLDLLKAEMPKEIETATENG